MASCQTAYIHYYLTRMCIPKNYRTLYPAWPSNVWENGKITSSMVSLLNLQHEKHHDGGTSQRWQQQIVDTNDFIYVKYVPVHAPTWCLLYLYYTNAAFVSVLNFEFLQQYLFQYRTVVLLLYKKNCVFWLDYFIWLSMDQQPQIHVSSVKLVV